MKKAVFKKLFAIGAVALASGAACAQASSVQLYGIVDVAYRHTNNEGPATDKGQSLNQMIGGGMSQSRWGINVNEDLGGGLKALVNLENRFTADNGATAGGYPNGSYFQQSWVGLQGGFGRVTVGRQYNILFDLVTSTYASYPYSPYMEVYKPEIGFALLARADNMIKYTAEVGSIRGALQYSFDEKAATGGKTMGGYLRYAADGLAAGVGYQDYEFASGKKIKAWTLGGSYRTGPWYFNLGYGENKVDKNLPASDAPVLGAMWGSAANGGFGGGAVFLNANKRSIYKIGAGYQLTPQLNLGAHYFHTKQSGATAAADATANFLTLAADYAFSKRTDAYFEVDNTKLKGGNIAFPNGATSRTGFTVGLRHRF
ncbi:porin Gram-negative type [Acidovorax delafieldii 2AN]|uniref:Porin Gram-negative type n=1 Tax=Acidovorax delafieldii 2AN TaxID=573060 RepID=C5T2W1_ACIDE|nr:porin [Acidovorax delafieldii]EER61172.1 porin Gram-negative type [Acidovorax delafieldii 2AN]